MRVVFAGTIGRFPVGGHAWVDLHYLLGLRALGAEVAYVEDCGPESWVYAWEVDGFTTDPGYPVAYLRACLGAFGFADRWIYRVGERAYGMDLDRFLDYADGADLLLVRGSPLEGWRPEYEAIRHKAFVDSDPGFTQIRYLNGEARTVVTIDRCDRLFTVGQRLGGADCGVPTLGREWSAIAPPIYLDEWPFCPDRADGRFSTVMQWRSYPEIVVDGRPIGNKDRVFDDFLRLPRRAPIGLHVALTGGDPEVFRRHGWEVSSGWRVSLRTQGYRRFIQASKGELSVAKQGYVELRTGWVSDRTGCYLASGRPAVLHDTGAGDLLPEGEGVRYFRTRREAERAIEASLADYADEQVKARRLAERLFDARAVLRGVLERTL